MWYLDSAATHRTDVPHKWVVRRSYSGNVHELEVYNLIQFIGQAHILIPGNLSVLSSGTVIL